MHRYVGGLSKEVFREDGGMTGQKNRLLTAWDSRIRGDVDEKPNGQTLVCALLCIRCLLSSLWVVGAMQNGVQVRIALGPEGGQHVANEVECPEFGLDGGELVFALAEHLPNASIECS